MQPSVQPLDFMTLSRTQYVRSGSVVSRVIAGETLIVPVRRGTADLASLFSFNSVGSVVWSALESPRTVDELVALLTETYDVEQDKAQEDLNALLVQMQAAGLVEVAE